MLIKSWYVIWVFTFSSVYDFRWLTWRISICAAVFFFYYIEFVALDGVLPLGGIQLWVWKTFQRPFVLTAVRREWFVLTADGWDVLYLNGRIIVILRASVLWAWMPATPKATVATKLWTCQPIGLIPWEVSLHWILLIECIADVPASSMALIARGILRIEAGIIICLVELVTCSSSQSLWQDLYLGWGFFLFDVLTCIFLYSWVHCICMLGSYCNVMLNAVFHVFKFVHNFFEYCQICLVAFFF